MALGIEEILEAHNKWLNDEPGGEQADLSGADLNGANLSRANLSRANLSRANLDYASYPISCKGLRMDIDDRLGVQLIYHAVSNILHSPHTSDQLKSEVSAVVEAANRFHRVDECGQLTPFEKIEG